MNSKYTNPNANVPEQDENDPLGDRGQDDKTWSPEDGQQGISNRPDDESDDSETPLSADDQNERAGHESIKGTDTLATTDAETMEREKGKRTTM